MTEAPAPRLLLGTREGLLALRLSPDGAGWTVAEVLWRHAAVRAIAVDPDDPRRLHLAAAGDGIYRSEDGGRTWERYLHVDAHVLVVRPDRPELLYLGAEPAEVFRSTDFGGNWTALGITQGIGDPLTPLSEWRHVRTLVFDPANGAAIHAVVEGGALLATFDGGRTWVELATRGLPTPPDCLLHVGGTNNALIAGTAQGILRSDDHGFHWHADGAGIAEPAITALTTVGDHLIAAAGQPEGSSESRRTHLYHRPPGAARWWPAGESVPGRVQALHAAPPTAPPAWLDTVFATTDEGSLWRAVQHGRAWNRMTRGLPTATALAWQPPAN
jgi:photosystem II stability/assembly factor-like uncharacterized protein